MALATQGFHVGAMPIAPTVPAGLGEFDASRARRQTAEQIELYKKLANLTAEQKATQAALALKAKQSTSDLGLVEPLAMEKVAAAGANTSAANLRSQVLREGGGDAVQGQVGALQDTVRDQDDMLTLRARATAEGPSVRQRIEDSTKLSDHDAEAAELEKIQADSPWLVLPEHKVLAEALKTSVANARARAMQQQKDTAAVSRTGAGRPPTGLTATIQLLLNEGYAIDDPVIQKLLLKQSAETAADPVADRAQKATTAAGTANTRSQSAIDVQKLRNEGAANVAGIRAQGTAGEYERHTNDYIKYNQMATEATDPVDKDMYEERGRIAREHMTALDMAKTRPSATSQAEKLIERSARHALTAHEDSTKRLTEAIDLAFRQVGPLTAGPMARTAWVGGIPSADLAASLKSITANVGFDMLAQLKAQSRTGGALGSVSDNEGRRLEAVLGSLEQSQSPSQLRQNLIKAKAAIELANIRMQEAYEADFPSGNPNAPAASTSPADKFEVGKVYTDAQGNRATYQGNGQWQEVP